MSEGLPTGITRDSGVQELLGNRIKCQLKLYPAAIVVDSPSGSLISDPEPIA